MEQWVDVLMWKLSCAVFITWNMLEDWDRISTNEEDFQSLEWSLNKWGICWIGISSNGEDFGGFLFNKWSWNICIHWCLDLLTHKVVPSRPLPNVQGYFWFSYLGYWLEDYWHRGFDDDLSKLDIYLYWVPYIITCQNTSSYIILNQNSDTILNSKPQA